MLRRLFLPLFCLMFSLPAEAVQLTQRGTVISLSGRIENGDQYLIKDFLATPSGRQARIVYLDSPGGFVQAAREMAREIRAAGLTTVVDAARARCHSACTGLFTGGVRRHYINSGRLQDGEAGLKPGLAFHDGSSINQRGQRDFSGAGTAGMINTYYEMGVGAAASLVQKASFKQLYYISGETALSLGIATSLAAP